MKRDFYINIYILFFIFASLFMYRVNTLWIYYDDFVPLFKYAAILLSFPVGGLCLQRYKPRQLLTVFAIGFLVLIVGINSDNILQLYLSYIMIVGAKDIPFRTIVKVHFVLALSFCLFNMTVSEMGMVKKTLTINDEREGFFEDIVERKDFGYGWSTDYAIHVFFILLDYWILKNGKLRIIEYLIYAGISYFIIVNCDSRMAAGNILLILLFAFFLGMINKRGKVPSKIVCFLLKSSVPLFAFLSIWATVAYNSSSLEWVGADMLLSGRLRLGNDAFKEVGIPWFGQNYKMYGAGNAGFGNADYNFLDCAYVQSLVIWGILLTAIWIYAYLMINKQANYRKDWTLMFAVFISAIAGVIAPYSFNLKYCVLLIALVAGHCVRVVPEREEDE